MALHLFIIFFLLIINYCHCAAAHLAPFAGERYNFCCFLVWGNAQISPPGCSELIHHSISCCSPQCKATQAHAQGSKRRSDVSQPFLNIKQATPNILEYTKTSRTNTSFLLFMYKAAACRLLFKTTARRRATSESTCIFYTAHNHLFASAAPRSCLAWSCRNPAGEQLRGPRGPSNGELDH